MFSARGFIDFCECEKKPVYEIFTEIKEVSMRSVPHNSQLSGKQGAKKKSSAPFCPITTFLVYSKFSKRKYELYELLKPIPNILPLCLFNIHSTSGHFISYSESCFNYSSSFHFIIFPIAVPKTAIKTHFTQTEY